MVKLTYLPSDFIENVVREVELTHRPGVPSKPVGELSSIKCGLVVSVDAAGGVTHHLV